MRVDITSFAERPELVDRLDEIGVDWPEFMSKDPVDAALHSRVLETFPEHCVVATGPDGRVVGHGRSIPFALDVDGRVELPDRGWDAVLQWGFADHRRSTPTDTVSALIMTVAPELTGQGISVQLLEAMRDAARKHGHGELVAPVRPTRKHLEPRTPMPEYAARVRDDGLPSDPWLRTHVRVGGVIEKVAPASMTISGSLAEWRSWTDLPFDRDGDVDVPGALVPVHCDTRHDHAVYIEPNVWMRHDLR
jgi:GNAT superfamily N-acetyltransferase